jgi:hypothetical protein
MGLALDEPRKTDEQIEVDGLTFVVDESEKHEVLRRGGLTVEHRTGWWGSSFVVTPAYGACC